MPKIKPQAITTTIDEASPVPKLPVDSSKQELEKYRSRVEICATFRLDASIPNGYAGHASILFSTFFKFSEKQVCIYTGRLFGGVFDEEPQVVESAINFLRRDQDRELRIALSEKIDYESFVKKPFIAKILKESDIKNRIHIFDASEIATVNHFAVMDNSAFRYETSHVQNQAIANFGNPARAEQLNNDFESIVRKAKPIKLTESPSSSQ